VIVKVRKKNRKPKSSNTNMWVSGQNMTQAIYEALLLIKKEEERESAEALALRESKQREILGEKDFSNIESGILRKIRESMNLLHCTWKKLNLSREEAKYFSTISGLTKILTNGLLSLIQIVLYLISLVFLGVAFFADIFFVHCVLLAFLFFVLGKFVRIAKFEIENIKDNAYLLNIAMMVIAIVTLFAPIVWNLICSVISEGGIWNDKADI